MRRLLQSPSYRENGTAVEIRHAGYNTAGFACIDTLHIGDLSIENQSFEETMKIQPTYFFDQCFESVIGLPLIEVNALESSLQAKSVFHNMIQQGLLE